jgi:prevent-host-death family protein
LAINSGYNKNAMDVSVAEAKNHFSTLLRSVEEGQSVVITRNGKPVAQLIPALPTGRAVRFGTLRGRIRLTPGWDDPIGVDDFLSGKL